MAEPPQRRTVIYATSALVNWMPFGNGTQQRMVHPGPTPIFDSSWGASTNWAGPAVPGDASPPRRICSTACCAASPRGTVTWRSTAWLATSFVYCTSFTRPRTGKRLPPTSKDVGDASAQRKDENETALRPCREP